MGGFFLAAYLRGFYLSHLPPVTCFWLLPCYTCFLFLFSYITLFYIFCVQLRLSVGTDTVHTRHPAGSIPANRLDFYFVGLLFLGLSGLYTRIFAFVSYVFDFPLSLFVICVTIASSKYRIYNSPVRR